VGCGTIKQTTTTTTEQQTIPKEIIHDTLRIPIELPLTDERTDSIGRWYLKNFCKGEMQVDEKGLKASIKFWMSSSVKKDVELAKKEKEAIQLKYEIEKKEQIIQEKKTITESKSTPGQLWIFFHSWQFTIPTALLFLVIGILLHAKSETIKRII
jgi:hypothetical protein